MINYWETFKDDMKAIFLDGQTTMACVWLMFLLGLIWGYLLKKC